MIPRHCFIKDNDGDKKTTTSWQHSESIKTNGGLICTDQQQHFDNESYYNKTTTGH